MKRLFSRLFLWSWLLTLPVTGLGAYWTYRTIDRFYLYSVRYDPTPLIILTLSNIGQYEYETLQQRVFAATSRIIKNRQSKLPFNHLFVPESNLAALESHMPQSAFDYVKATMAQVATDRRQAICDG